MRSPYFSTQNLYQNVCPHKQENLHNRKVWNKAHHMQGSWSSAWSWISLQIYKILFLTRKRVSRSVCLLTTMCTESFQKSWAMHTGHGPAACALIEVNEVCHKATQVLMLFSLHVFPFSHYWLENRFLKLIQVISIVLCHCGPSSWPEISTSVCKQWHGRGCRTVFFWGRKKCWGGGQLVHHEA